MGFMWLVKIFFVDPLKTLPQRLFPLYPSQHTKLLIDTQLAQYVPPRLAVILARVIFGCTY
jgi:hypothetical protein